MLEQEDAEEQDAEEQDEDAKLSGGRRERRDLALVVVSGNCVDIMFLPKLLVIARWRC